MNIFVTGSTGFIGSHLCTKLVKLGHYVVGLSHSSNTNKIEPLLSSDNFKLVKGGLQDTKFLCDIVKNNDIRAIIHLAAIIPRSNTINNIFEYFDVNARGSLNLLHAAKIMGIEKFLYGSSMSVYSEPPCYLPVDEKHPTWPSTAYGISKLDGELYCSIYRDLFDITVLRYGGVYGKGQPDENAIPKFIYKSISNEAITIYGDGSQTSDYAYIDDIIVGTLLAFEKVNKFNVYNLGSGQEISVSDLAEKIVSITNSKSRIIKVDENTDRPFRFVMDISKSKKDLGYSPRSLDKGLRMFLSELKCFSKS